MAKANADSITRPSRRSILRSLGFAPTAALVPASALWAKPATAATPENPELLALGEQIEPLLTTYRAAVVHKDAALAMAQSLCPPVPDELVRKKEDDAIFNRCTDDEKDVEGRIVWSGPKQSQVRRILKADLLKLRMWEMREGGYGPRSKHTRRLKVLIPIAEKYEAKFQQAVERSNLETRWEELRQAASDIEALAWDLRDQEPKTMAGIIILARVEEALCEVRKISGAYMDILGPNISRSIIRIAGNNDAAVLQ